MLAFVIPSDRILGLLAHTMGSPDQAAAHFEDALTFCRKGGYRPELAWTCCDYADTLLRRKGEGDRSKAVALLDESLAISSELGMRPLHAALDGAGPVPAGDIGGIMVPAETRCSNPGPERCA